MMNSNCVIQKVTTFGNSLLPDYSNENESQSFESYPSTLGGVLNNGMYIWMANGPTLRVINSKTNREVSCWIFGSLLKDKTVRINCVTELPQISRKFPLLIVGLRCVMNRGMICIFEFTGSRVLRAIEFPSEVSSIGIIDTGLNNCILPGPLRIFDGALAVGTLGGEIYLIDLCLESCQETIYSSTKFRDERNFCGLMEVSLDDISFLDTLKQLSSEKSEHLAVCLNDVEMDARKVFILKGPNEKECLHVNKQEVIVSSLQYIPQLGSILVGYNFGAWQLWNLFEMKLLYTSSVFKNNFPVTHFSIQEPCDDPRAFCYIWVTYNNMENYSNGFPTCLLFALQYESKEWHEGYGILYNDLRSCSTRFQRELVPLDNRNTEFVGGQLLNMISVNKGVNKTNSAFDSQEDSCSYCFFIWNIWDRNGTKKYSYLSLFDLNQWYKEQMPSGIQKGVENSYITNTYLSDIIESADLLDVFVNVNSISQFKGSVRLEEHYLPSSVSFDMYVLKEDQLLYIKSTGNQKQLLFFMESEGPLCFVEPIELYHKSIMLGLTPLFIEPIPVTLATLEFQREFMLNVALEHQLIGCLCKCASLSITGTFPSSGFTLNFLLKWGWQRAHVLKQNADSLCVPLFDHSGEKLDSNSKEILNNCIRQLENLVTFFKYVLSKFKGKLYNQELIEEQYSSLEMTAKYLVVIQWSFSVGLLPEDDNLYPFKELNECYFKRRSYLNHLMQKKYNFGDNILYIDNLIELNQNGTSVQQEWMKDGGNGLYPPNSLQALLRTYLIKGVDITHKHSIVMYVFLDLAFTLDEERYKSLMMQLSKFSAVFQLSPSLVKITQAFWQLDNGDCSAAVKQLLDPLVKRYDLELWHHRTALHSFLLQGYHNFSLLYFQVVKPAVTKVHDLCFIISLYMVNGMVDEAFHFQRNYAKSVNGTHLLYYFFKECTNRNQLETILKLPLDLREESYFKNYLENLKQPQYETIKAIYKNKEENFNPRNRPDFLHFSQHKNVPAITQKISSFYQMHNDWNKINENDKMPLSLFVNNKLHNKSYKSNFIYAAVSKTKSLSSFKEDSQQQQNLNSNEQPPFLKIPSLAKSRKRSLTSVIYPEQMNVEAEECLIGPYPLKRRMISQHSHHSDADFHLISFDTPVVKRNEFIEKSRTGTSFTSATGTPQSILKKKEEAKDNTSCFTEMEATPKKRTISISPRPPISSRLAVHFESSILKSNSPSNKIVGVNASLSNINENAGLSNIDENSEGTDEMKSSNASTDENYGTPEFSFEDLNKEENSKGEEKVNYIEGDSKIILNNSLTLRSRRSYKNMKFTVEDLKPPKCPVIDIKDNENESSKSNYSSENSKDTSDKNDDYQSEDKSFNLISDKIDDKCSVENENFVFNSSSETNIEIEKDVNLFDVETSKVDDSNENYFESTVIEESTLSDIYGSLTNQSISSNAISAAFFEAFERRENQVTEMDSIYSEQISDDDKLSNLSKSSESCDVYKQMKDDISVSSVSLITDKSLDEEQKESSIEIKKKKKENQKNEKTKKRKSIQVEPVISTRILRSRSIEPVTSNITPAKRKRTNSTCSLPTINEINDVQKKNNPKATTSRRSSCSDFSTKDEVVSFSDSRRLTRRQKMLLEEKNVLHTINEEKEDTKPRSESKPKENKPKKKNTSATEIKSRIITRRKSSVSEEQNSAGPVTRKRRLRSTSD